jgi:hypothetical protein
MIRTDDDSGHRARASRPFALEIITPPGGYTRHYSQVALQGLGKGCARYRRLTPKRSGCEAQFLLAYAWPAAARLKALADELEALRGKQVRKAATWLRNCAEPVCRYISETTARLMALTDDPRSMRVVEQTCVFWRLSKEEEKRFFAWRRHERLKEAQAVLDTLAGIDLDEALVKTLMTQTIEVIEKRARAESLAECVGAVLRPYLAVHKRVTQEALDLFCFWWNFHRRTTGWLKDSRPFTKMTGTKVHD